jgi:hypothetical protein
LGGRGISLIISSLTGVVSDFWVTSSNAELSRVARAAI